MHRLEESYWFLRARSNELKDGDKNTKYFHHKSSSRRRRNLIKGLTDNNGVWKSDPTAMQSIIANYFSQIFDAELSDDANTALGGLSRKVLEEMNETLDRAPSDTKIKDALFQMHPTKAPGPGGFHALFFQTFWSTVGEDVISFVKSWWYGTASLEGISKTCISLIPKCKHPKVITEFRPINCYNVLYKIMSKVMANKLKPFLGDIISFNQSAFIWKRSITDSASIAFEFFHSMKRKVSSSKGCFALKLDMSKAYDRVEWGFLEKVKWRMGFSDDWVRRIMDCISSVSFSFKLNGNIFGDLKPSRGLR